VNLYTLARRVQTIKAAASGDPKRIGRRAKNVVVGRALGRGRVWRRLWR
jgi:hypothetical protein